MLGAMSEVDPIIELLQKDARRSPEQLAELLSGQSGDEVAGKIASWEEDGTILGYQAVVDSERTGDAGVRAFIEVTVTPERGGGFDRLAARIAKFDQVRSCFLMSGRYDLLVAVEGSGLHEVASFVSEKLASLEGVLSTSTHFQLKAYKQNGFLNQAEGDDARLAVSP